MDVTNNSETEAVLREWRNKILNVFLTVVAVVAGVMTVLTIWDATSQPAKWPLVDLYCALALVLGALAIFRGIDSRVRAWGVLVVPYVVGVTTLASYGLGSGGRLYLLALPIGALILIGVRAGLLMSALSVLTYAAFAFLADRGLLAQWLLGERNSLLLTDWVAESGDTLGLLAILMALLILFYRFQERLIGQERRARAELMGAQRLLEQQNATLEQKVQERTAELAQANNAKDAMLAEQQVVLDAIDYGILLLGPDLRTRIGNRALRDMWRLPEDLISGRPTLAELINFNRHTALYGVPEERFDAYVQEREAAVVAGPIPATEFQRGDGRILRLKGTVLPNGGRMLTYFDITELAEATREAEEAQAVAEQANRERGALLDEMVRQNQFLAALHDTTVGLISRLDVNELLEAVLSRAGQLLNAPHGFIYLAEPGAADLECRVGVGALSRLVGSRPKPGEGLGGQVWQTGQAVVVNDYDRWPGRLDYFPLGLLGAAMAVPLRSGDQVVGAIGLAYDPGTDHTFDKQELELLNRFAQLASVALDNARLYSTAQDAQRRMADIINFMPDPVLVIDREGKVIAWNRAIEEMTGTKAEEMLGKGNYEYALPFYGERRPILIDLVTMPRKELEEKYTAIRMEGQVLVGETYVPHLKGGGVYLLGTASALHDAKGNVVGAIEVIRDFTERKHMEEDLHQAKEAAEAATQAKSAFLATMSHEIRTPMNAVIGMTGLLLDTPLAPEQREFAETIRTSGDALLTIINDILDFSKIEAGRMELESQPFDLRECVESAVDLLAARAAEKGLDLSCVVGSEVPAAIVGDVTRLRQILVNLLGNAVKFTERGEVVVMVACEEDTEIGRQGEGERAFPASPRLAVPTSPRLPLPVSLHFAVRDTGIGIPADRQSRLFQSFSQVDTSTTRRFGGTGLGLAISKRLTELMGGSMWVESEGVPGKGSTFHFTIQAEVAQALAPRPYLEAFQPRLEGKRVLIVDDNATNRHILTLQTQAWGMLPCDTASPHEALAWIGRGDPFDLALLDLQMPEMDGRMLAEEIYRLREAHQLPIVILSSLGQPEAHLEALEMAAYLLKPIKASQLYNSLVGIFGPGEEVTAVEEKGRYHFDAEMGKRHPLSILLAEDNATNQKLALLVLERLGYRADVAGNGLEVLRALRRQPYDVVLMDVQMPEMDGLEATRAIGREFDAERRPRIVAMTANAMKEDRDECFAAGMDDFMSKPIQLTELVAALNRCQARELAATSERPAQPAPVAAEAPAAHGVETSPESEATAASEPAAPVFDPAALERLRGTLGKQADAMLPSLMDTYFKDAPKLIADAQRCWEQGQAADLRRAAHSLKSSSATFGAMALSALARELEYKARDGTLEGGDELLRRIQAEYAQAKAALEAQRKES